MLVGEQRFLAAAKVKSEEVLSIERARRAGWMSDRAGSRRSCTGQKEITRFGVVVMHALWPWSHISGGNVSITLETAYGHEFAFPLWDHRRCDCAASVKGVWRFGRAGKIKIRPGE